MSEIGDYIYGKQVKAIRRLIKDEYEALSFKYTQEELDKALLDDSHSTDESFGINSDLSVWMSVPVGVTCLTLMLALCEAIMPGALSFEQSLIARSILALLALASAVLMWFVRGRYAHECSYCVMMRRASILSQLADVALFVVPMVFVLMNDVSVVGSAQSTLSLFILTYVTHVELSVSSLAYITRVYDNGWLPISSSVMHIFAQFVPVVSIIDTIYLYVVGRKTETFLEGNWKLEAFNGLVD